MPSLPDYSPQVQPQELIQILNLLAKAPVTVGEAHAVSLVLDKLISFANGKHPIGPLIPPLVELTPEADHDLDA